MNLPLTYYGNPILRKKAEKVQEIDQEIRTLLENMIETMNHANGIGIAAPQVNYSLAIFVVCAPIQATEDDEGEWLPGKLRVFINPTLSEPSTETWEYLEGCLSIPGIQASVNRPWKITVEAQDLKGNWFKEEFSGLEARVIMHENDHINGTLFIDRISSQTRKKIESKLQKIKKAS